MSIARNGTFGYLPVNNKYAIPANEYKSRIKKIRIMQPPCVTD